MSPRDSSLQFGEATKEGKESEADGSSRIEDADRNKEVKPETQGQGVTKSGSRPRQGKVVASRREALECMIVRGAEGKAKKSKGNK